MNLHACFWHKADIPEMFDHVRVQGEADVY